MIFFLVGLIIIIQMGREDILFVKKTFFCLNTF